MKEIIIISLIVLAVYLYYQQNNQPNDQEIRALKRELDNYKNLYQKRLEKDSGEEAAQLKKIKTLENQLKDLAEQRLVGKKEFEELVEQLKENLVQSFLVEKKELSEKLAKAEKILEKYNLTYLLE